MFSSLRHLIGWVIRALGSRLLVLENLALREQLLAVHAKRPRRRLSAMHKLFWVLLRRLWSGWKRPHDVLVTPRTVVEWHRAGFRLCCKWLSRTRAASGRKSVSKEVRGLIFHLAGRESHLGEHRVSTASCSSWASRYPSHRSRVGCDERPGAPT